MLEKIVKPSDMLAWVYDKLDKRTSLPKGEDYFEYRSEVEKIAVKYKNDFSSFKIELFERYQTTDESDFCLAVMNIVSLYYKESYDIKIFGLPSIKKGESLIPLNNLFSDKYLVYPKSDKVFIDLINKIIDGQLRKKNYSNPINEHLENYVIVKKTDLKDFEYKVITYNDMKYVTNLREDKKLTIAFVPFIKEKISKYFEIDEDTKKGFFEVKGVKSEKLGLELENRYFQSLKSVLEDERSPELILFPEMILTNQIILKLPKFLKDMRIKRSVLILAGTLWENNTNTAFLYNHKGDLVAKQDKYHAFEYTKADKYRMVEKIRSVGPHKLNILDVKNIGRIAIFICRDMKHHEYLSLLRLIDVDILLAPSYSDSNDVLSEVDNLTENNHTTVIFLNACSSNKEVIGKINLPSKEGTNRVTKPVLIKNDICSSCSEFCNGVVFELDLEKEFSKRD